MKKITENQIKKQVIKIINDSKIEDVIYEPRYIPDYKSPRGILIGSVITIITSNEK